jgi:subtilase family serine protease
LTARLVGCLAVLVGFSTTAAPAGAATRVGSPTANRPLQLVLPLAADQAGLQRFADGVSTPGSPQYGQYRSISWLSRRFGASPAAQAKVIGFLRNAGARHVRADATGLFVDAVLPAGRAQHLFATTLAEFHAARGGDYTAPAAPVSLPRALRGLVTGVVGLDTRAVAAAPSIQRPGADRAAFSNDSSSVSGYSPVTGSPQGCSAGLAPGGFAPNQYLTAYGYEPLQSASELGQNERVALIEIDGFRQSDISTFAGCFGLRLPTINGFGVGISRPLAPGGEATLDLEVLDAAAPGLKSIDVYEATSQPANVLLALTAPLQNPGFRPQVISASLGLCEPSLQQSVGNGGIRATEEALEEAAASGISFLAASGDAGSADCVDSQSPNAAPLPVLAVNYPASSPWATGVGGTNLALNAQNGIEAGTVWNDTALTAPAGDGVAAGGGGFSGLFTRPSYQKGTVTENRRAVPDVGMLADISPGYDVYCTASPDCVGTAGAKPWQAVGGTSAATPLLAGGLALIDEMLRAHRQQNLGLVNPLLYQAGRNTREAPSVFSDVTTGSNDVGRYIQPSGRPLGCCSAHAGFDEASGWGGVNLAALSLVALATQPKVVYVGLSLPARQRPVAARHLLVTVSCTGGCRFGAYARVTIGRARPFTDYSGLHRMSRAGRHTVQIDFAPGQLRKLRAALAAHTRVSAKITGALVGSGGAIESRTAARSLKITR